MAETRAYLAACTLYSSDAAKVTLLRMGLANLAIAPLFRMTTPTEA